MGIEGIEKIKRSTLSDDVINRLRYMIENNYIKSGEKLPAERELAAMFGVGRSSVREALRVLQTIGALDRKQGIGTYLNDRAQLSLQRVNQVVEKYTFMEMTEARNVIEAQTAELAAIKASSSEIRAMEAAFRKHTKLARSHLESEITILDFNFHRAVVQGTQNTLLLRMFDVLRDILISSNYAVLSEDTVTNAILYHEQILEAIKVHKPERAKTIMKEHIFHVKNNIIQIFESDEEEKHDRKRTADKRLKA